MSTTIAPCPGCEKLNRVPLGRAEAENPVCGHCQTQLPIEHGVVQVNGSLLQKLINHTNLTPVSLIADFYGTWCAPCRTFEPEFQKAALQMANQTGGKFIFAKLNTQDHLLAASAYQIRTLPTLILFRGGVETARQFGALPFPILIQWLNANAPSSPEQFAA